MAKEKSTTATLNRLLRHQIQIERAKSGEIKRVRSVLSKVDDQIALLILKLPKNYTQRDINKLVKDINNLTNSFYAKTVQKTFDQIKETVVSFETDFSFVTVRDFLEGEEAAKTVSKQKVLNRVNKEKFQGKTLDNWNKRLAKDKAKRVEVEIRNSAITNASPSRIASAAKKGIRAANNNSQAVTTAYFNQSSNISRDQVYSENDTRVLEIVWNSVLDSGTTLTCGVRSNKRYDAITKEPIGHNAEWREGPGKIHFGCRSVGVPIDADGIITQGSGKDFKYDEGSRTALGAEDGYERGDYKSSETGKRYQRHTDKNFIERQVVSANTDYETWLRTQPREFVEDVLGPSKAERFLDQNLSLNKFVVPSGRELTVKQLNQKLGAI